jgi:hypothetical protein
MMCVFLAMNENFKSIYIRLDSSSDLGLPDLLSRLIFHLVFHMRFVQIAGFFRIYACLAYIPLYRRR